MNAMTAAAGRRAAMLLPWRTLMLAAVAIWAFLGLGAVSKINLAPRQLPIARHKSLGFRSSNDQYVIVMNESPRNSDFLYL